MQKLKYEALHLFSQTYLFIEGENNKKLEISVLKLSLQKCLRIGFYIWGYIQWFSSGENWQCLEIFWVVPSVDSCDATGIQQIEARDTT